MKAARTAACALMLASGMAGSQTPGNGAMDDGGPATPPVHAGEWNFRATLDGQTIGQHRFSVRVQGDQFTVASDAGFDVKLLGFTVYRYRHHAVEHWRGGCLQDISATTEDNGKRASVEGERKGAGFVTTGPSGRETLEGCVMSFAYWNPALQTRTQLLNAQTGRYDSVRIARLDAKGVDVRGRTVMAQHLRIDGDEAPIDLWVSPQGEWVGLDTTVSGGRKLSYRLD